MSEFFLGKQSRSCLIGVHPDLVGLCFVAIDVSTVDFRITEGKRTWDRQLALYREKKTLTRNSRHMHGCAIDVVALVDGGVSWEWKYYQDIANAFSIASMKTRIPVIWGGTWKSLKDGPHFELPRDDYPDGCLGKVRIY